MQYASFTLPRDDSTSRGKQAITKRCAMSITMNMSSYEIEQDSKEAEYSDDILFAGWNPEVDLLNQEQLTPALEQQSMPVAVTTEVVELFLRKMYSYQR
jgi:hypothetical protein